MKPYYEQDGITIYHGDCREAESVLSGSRFDLVMADPPYGQTSLDWDVWQSGWIEGLANYTSSMWCFGSLRMFMDRVLEFSEAGWKLSQDIVWEKHNGSNFSADRFRRVHDQACHFYRGSWESIYHIAPRVEHSGPRKTVRKRGQTPHTGAIGNTGYTDDGLRMQRSVMRVPSMHGNAENETQKPQAIVAPLVEYGCPAFGSVLVPFVGSGTDLEVARLSGRTAVGFDVREDQCEKAARRIAGLLPMEYSA